MRYLAHSADDHMSCILILWTDTQTLDVCKIYWTDKEKRESTLIYDADMWSLLGAHI